MSPTLRLRVLRSGVLLGGIAVVSSFRHLSGMLQGLAIAVAFCIYAVSHGLVSSFRCPHCGRRFAFRGGLQDVLLALPRAYFARRCATCGKRPR